MRLKGLICEIQLSNIKLTELKMREKHKKANLKKKSTVHCSLFENVVTDTAAKRITHARPQSSRVNYARPPSV